MELRGSGREGIQADAQDSKSSNWTGSVVFIRIEDSDGCNVGRSGNELDSVYAASVVPASHSSGGLS